MIISVRKLIRLIRMWIFILICTILVYQMIHIVRVVLWQADPYKPPKGHSIRVQASAVEKPWYVEDLQRLRVFYITGE